MNLDPHMLNWQAGWWLLLAGFASGAVMGLGFHRPEFMGGYDSFRRRMTRLGHIACCALGMLNLVVALGPTTAPLFVAGGVAMPLVCWLAAWRKAWRHLFFIPVLCLVAGVALMIHGGRDGARPSTLFTGGPRSVVAGSDEGGPK